MKSLWNNRFDRVIIISLIVLTLTGLIGQAVLSDGNEKPSAAETTTTSKRASTTSSTKPKPATTTVPKPKIPESMKSFTSVSFAVQPAVGERTATKCALNAVSTQAQAQGLAGRSDLAGFDALIFTFDKEVDFPFWGKAVKVPITVVWFDKDGKYVDQTNIDPCPDTDTNCKRYGSGGPYKYALEVVKGQLGGLRIADGSSISFGSTCAA